MAENKSKSNREKENRELIAAFQKIDKDKNGFIDRRELKALFDSLKVDITNDQIKGIIAEYDENGDGSISFPEFVKMYEDLMQVI